MVIERFVVKIGSSVLTDERGRLLSERMTRIADQVAVAGIHQVILVSSGAIACGLAALRLSRRPTAMAQLQACAAVGQSELMHRYTLAFGRRHLTTAQILLTQEDFAHPVRFRNAKQTLLTLLRRRVVPIVNENDTVSVEEITFGDNDRLAAMVAVAVDAQLLVVLSDVDGFLKDGRLIERVETLSEARAAVHASTRHTTRGGMASKLEAARIAGHSGIPMVIANGAHPTVLTDLLQGKPVGTLFVPPRNRLTSKKWWIAFSLRQPKGAVVIDEGAAAALLERGKSLLASGVVGVTGRFEAGDCVAVVTGEGREVARGVCRYASSELARVRGLNSEEVAKTLGHPQAREVVHRDQLVLARELAHG